MRSRPLAAAWPLLALCVLLTSTTVTDAAPEGLVTYAFHVTLAPRWLDPGETESAITSFKVLYAIHDALVKPMPTGQTTPSLAESWAMAPDGLSYTFVLRQNAKFHNGDPVTPEDVKFSFDRYKGGAAKLLKDKVKDVRSQEARGDAAPDPEDPQRQGDICLDLGEWLHSRRGRQGRGAGPHPDPRLPVLGAVRRGPAQAAIARAAWGSDYPHGDGVWPESSKYIEEQFGHLPADVTHKITCENAGKFHGLM